MAGPHGEVIGRDGELARLRELLDRAKAGESASIAIFGPAGQGKTSVLDRLCADAGDDVEVVRVTGIEAESELPFGALDALLRPLLPYLDALPAAQRSALEGALAISEQGAVAPFAIGAGTLSLLGAAADASPLLCVVDDLQWVDGPSLQALLFAVRRLSRERVAVVLSTRGEDAPGVDLRGIERLRIGPLSDADCARLLDTLSGGRMAPETRAQLAGAAAGNPLLLFELAARLTPAQREGRDRLIGPPPPATEAHELLAERVAALPPAGADALLVAAACEDDGLAIVSAAIAANGSAIGDLATAEERGLVTLSAGRIAFRHPLVRSVAYHGALPEARRRAHAAVAAAMADADPRRIWHLAAASAQPDAALADRLAAEATKAYLRGGYASAARIRTRAADLTPHVAVRLDRLLEAVNDFEVAGDFEQAARVLSRAEGLAHESPMDVRIAGVRASLDLRGGDPAGARTRLLACAAELEHSLPRSAARFYLQAAYASMAVGDATSWREHAGSALRVVTAEDRATLYVGKAMLAAAAVTDLALDEAEPLLAEVEDYLLGDRSEPVGGAIEVFALMARALIWAERFDAADRILARLEADARLLSNGAGLPSVLNMRVILDGLLGRWANASAASAEQIALARDIGEGIFLPSGLMLGAWLMALRGRAEECDALAGEVLRGPQGENPAIGVWAHYGLGVLALGRGEVERAVLELGRLEGVAGFPEPGSRLWEPDLIEALIRAGDAERARPRLDRWTAEGEATGRQLVRATAARCQGLLAPDDEFEARFAEALELHADMPLPLETARTQLCLGERLRRTKRRADARAPLREALATFERLGATDLAARARAELRATGAMVPAQRRSDLEELTPHEVRVAMMVAEGKTNREVAAALFVAPKTIEHHLSAIFRKLGIKRRTELARVFASELAEQS